MAQLQLRCFASVMLHDTHIAPTCQHFYLLFAVHEDSAKLPMEPFGTPAARGSPLSVVQRHAHCCVFLSHSPSQAVPF